MQELADRFPLSGTWRKKNNTGYNQSSSFILVQELVRPSFLSATLTPSKTLSYKIQNEKEREKIYAGEKYEEYS